MTPIFKNQAVNPQGTQSGYHGYWTLDFTSIDPHLGTNQELKDLVSAAHKKGLKIFFDIVINHTADVIKYTESHNLDGSNKEGFLNGPGYRSLDESATNPYEVFIVEGDEGLKTPAWLNDISLYHNQGDSTFNGESSVYGDFFGLDDVKTEDPQVVAGMIEVFKDWITEYNIDGYRVDTVKHVNIEFWQQWAPAIKEHAASLGRDDFFIFGEVFDGAPRNLSYYTTQGQLPSVLDFGLYYQLQSFFANNAGIGGLQWAFDNDDLYTDGDSNVNTLMNFAGNHDTGRIGNFIQTNHGTAPEAEKLARAKLANAFLFFARGIPVIYYGDEQGFTGDGDSDDSREDMMPSTTPSFTDNLLIGSTASPADDNFDQTHPLYTSIQEFAKIYKSNKGLRSGTQFERFASDAQKVYAFSRVDAEKQVEYLIAFNTSNLEQSFTVPATASKYKELYPSNAKIDADVDGNIEVTVGPLDFVIYKAKSKIQPLAGDLAVSFNNFSAGGCVCGLTEFGADVTLDGVNVSEQTLPLYQVAYEMKLADGAWESLGTDFNPPYRVYLNAEGIANGTPISVRATVTDALGQSAVAEESGVVDIPPGMNIMFKKPEAWGEDVNIFWFDALEPSPEWPGVAMRSHGDGWYSYKFPDGTATGTLIFNDGAQQSTNQVQSGDGCFDGETETWTASCDLPFFVYFQAPAGWGTEVTVNAGAQSVLMTDLGEGWFEGLLLDGTAEVAVSFTDGVNSADAGLRGSTGCYSAETEAWSDSCELPSADLGPYGVEIFVRGNMNSWGSADPLVFVGSNTYAATINLPVGTAEFKVADENWTNGTNFGAHFTESDGVWEFGIPERIQDAGGVNPTVVIAEAGDYEFTILIDSILTEPLMSIRPAADTAPVAPTLFLRGSMNEWGANLPLTYMGNQAYYLRTPLDAGTHAFKIADENWSVGSSFGAHFTDSDGVVEEGIAESLQDQASGNLNFEAAAAGDFVFDLQFGTPVNEPGLTISPVVTP
jgi:glycosidase